VVLYVVKKSDWREQSESKRNGNSADNYIGTGAENPGCSIL
jgi:hypothetical protein